MSLPTTNPAQSSIRSFFQSAPPKYAPPPSHTQGNDTTLPNPTVLESPPKAINPPKTRADFPPLPTDLPDEATIRPITDLDLPALRRINALLLPVSYPDSFYASVVSSRLSRVIIWTYSNEEPKVVGGVVCRVQLESPDTNPNVQTLYIQSLCLLSPYRGLGLVNAAVDNILATAVKETDARTATAHVWTENDEALRWYESRGFTRSGNPVKGYYLKLRPDSAWLIQRDITTSVLKSVPNGSTPPIGQPVKASITAAAVNLPPISGPPRLTPSAPGTPTSCPPRPTLSSRTSTGQSFMDKRAETEWNDLPADMASGLLAPPIGGSAPASGRSSRSSSQARKKKDRSYPAAAFGS